jgi:hypothetical protein
MTGTANGHALEGFRAYSSELASSAVVGQRSSAPYAADCVPRIVSSLRVSVSIGRLRQPRWMEGRRLFAAVRLQTHFDLRGFHARRRAEAADDAQGAQK